VGAELPRKAPISVLRSIPVGWMPGSRISPPGWETVRYRYAGQRCIGRAQDGRTFRFVGGCHIGCSDRPGGRVSELLSFCARSREMGAGHSIFAHIDLGWRLGFIAMKYATPGFLGKVKGNLASVI